jgi:hypothetical protein
MGTFGGTGSSGTFGGTGTSGTFGGTSSSGTFGGTGSSGTFGGTGSSGTFGKTGSSGTFDSSSSHQHQNGPFYPYSYYDPYNNYQRPYPERRGYAAGGCEQLPTCRLSPWGIVLSMASFFGNFFHFLCDIVLT